MRFRALFIGGPVDGQERVLVGDYRQVQVPSRGTPECIYRLLFAFGESHTLVYSLYSIEAKVFMHGREMVSLPFVAYGILNYLRLAETENTGDSPVEFVYNSRSSQICAVCWIIAVLWSLGIW